MGSDREDFSRKLLATFRGEAKEHIEAMSSGLLALEHLTGRERAQVLETIFREAHSLKGAARAVNLLDLEGLCHSLEDLFAGMTRDRFAVTAGLFDLFHEVLDVLRQLARAEPKAPPDPRVPLLNRRMADTLSGAKQEAPPASLSPPPRAHPASEPQPTDPQDPRPARLHEEATVRIRTSKLDSILRETEELLGPRLAAAQRVIELRETRATLSAWRKRRSAVEPFRKVVERSIADSSAAGVRLLPRQISKVLEYVEEQDQLLRTVESRLATIESVAQADQRLLLHITDCLFGDVKETCMLPFSTLLQGLPRVVRDLARERGKNVELVVRGAEIEIDRRILEEMNAPMIHLVRNSVDHGVEIPSVRQEKGKTAVARLTVDVSHKNGGVEIVVADDGAGVDTAKVKSMAEKLGISPPDRETWSDQESISLIFHSGFSTNPIITGTSGRGLGLAIVREKVDRLAGSVEIESVPDRGTRVIMRLPLTLATSRGVVVSSGGRPFIIPSGGIERVTRVATSEVRTVENRETISVDGRPVPLVALADVLELPRRDEPEGARIPVIVLGAATGAIAFHVDEVLAEQEILIKGLGPQLQRVRNVAGVTVVGSGEIVPVLSVSDLMRSAVHVGTPTPHLARPEGGRKERKSILLAEDSITSRMLLKNILETAGYAVSVASDGLDAWTTLRTGTFDLIVSDVEMPRMDGFSLTEKVRGDPSRSDLPVVLVTALESREHRERGVDAGANAYIVKSSFDQSDLLEAVRRLIG